MSELYPNSTNSLGATNAATSTTVGNAWWGPTSYPLPNYYNHYYYHTLNDAEMDQIADKVIDKLKLQLVDMLDKETLAKLVVQALSGTDSH